MALGGAPGDTYHSIRELPGDRGLRLVTLVERVDAGRKYPHMCG